MSRMVRIFIGLVICLMISVNSRSQNRLEVSNRKPIFLDFTKMHKAGGKTMVLSENTQWLNYTVLVEQSDPSVSISVSIASGQIPEGMELFVEAESYRGFSRGKMGHPVGRIPLTNMPHTLIENIGTSYSGSGNSEGHKITFYVRVNDYAKLEPGTYTIYVHYTINQ